MEADELQKRTAVGGTASGDPIPPQGAQIADPISSPLRAQSPYNRRRGDRRLSPTAFWRSLKGPRRRSGSRRDREGENTYVDRYRKTDLLLLAAVFGLNIADAAFTLVWVGKGGSESNPIMDWFLQQGELVFLAQKCLVVGFWLVILVVHKNFRIARAGLWFLLVLYGSIFVYHIFLQTVGVPAPPYLGLAAPR